MSSIEELMGEIISISNDVQRHSSELNKVSSAISPIVKKIESNFKNSQEKYDAIASLNRAKVAATNAMNEVNQFKGTANNYIAIIRK